MVVPLPVASPDTVVVWFPCKDIDYEYELQYYLLIQPRLVRFCYWRLSIMSMSLQYYLLITPSTCAFVIAVKYWL